MKFTQEIKDNWLTDLKSGESKQGFGSLYNKADNSYCCYGRLQKLLGEDDLSQAVSGKALCMVKEVCGDEVADNLWLANDKGRYKKNYPRDYSNVIPLIEQFPVSE